MTAARRDRTRATSTVVSYVLALAITAVLVSGLLMAGGNLVEDQREEVVRTELSALGQTLAADIEGADRLAGTVESGRVALRISLPRQAGGLGYTVAVNQTGTDRIRFSTRRPAVTVVVSVVTDAPVAASTITGGDIVVTYDGTVLEVQGA